MRTFRNFIIFVVLVVIAFGAGYGLGYWKLQSAEKEWASARGEMQSKIGNLEKELAKARTRETLREMYDILSQVVADLSEKNFGLAGKHLDRVKEACRGSASLPPEMRNELDYLPAAMRRDQERNPNFEPRSPEKSRGDEESLRSKFKPG